MTFGTFRLSALGGLLSYNTCIECLIMRFSPLPPVSVRVFAPALLLTGVLLAACKAEAPGKAGAGDGKVEEAAAEAVPVEAVRVTRRTMVASHAGTAALEARAEAQVVAKTSGVALQVLAEEGQAVRAGQPLARLDSDRARLQVAQTQAQVAKLEANFRRAEQLSSQRMISANDVDQLRFDLQNARAANQMARLELSYATVVAPISGVVASKSVKPGNFVQINSPIFRIVDSSRLEATLNVPERDIDRIKPGQNVGLTVDAMPGKQFFGRIDRVAPVVDAGSGTFRVICSFAGGDGLQAGMFGRLAIRYEEREGVLAMPRTALLEDGGDAAVFVVRAGKVARVAVKTGHVDGEYVEVLEGLGEGDEVVTAGKSTLREGSAVQVIAAVPAAGQEAR